MSLKVTDSMLVQRVLTLDHPPLTHLYQNITMYHVEYKPGLK